MLTVAHSLLLAAFLSVGISLPTRIHQMENSIIVDQSSSKEEWPAMDIPWAGKGYIPFDSSSLDSVTEHIDRGFERKHGNEINSIFVIGSDTHRFDAEASQLLYYFLSMMTP